MMRERGVVVSHDTPRQWCQKFGQTYANGLRRRRPRPGDQWHLDEIFITINGKTHYLWRAVDQDGAVLDILVQPRRNAKARQNHQVLSSAAEGIAVRATGGRHRQTAQLRGRAPHGNALSGAPILEVSEYQGRELPSTHRQRERAMTKFTSPGGA
jgi:putative transposase